MMRQRSKRELWETTQPRYLKASKTEKQKILDEFTATTGYHRKYAIRILRHGYPRGEHKRRGKKPIYRGEVVVALEQIWKYMDASAPSACTLSCQKGSEY